MDISREKEEYIECQEENEFNEIKMLTYNYFKNIVQNLKFNNK